MTAPSSVRRVVVAVLAPPVWVPASVEPGEWRAALAEDILDVLARLVEAEPAIAATDVDALSVGWPGLRRYGLRRLDVVSLFAAAAADGFDQAVLLAGDAPDLPGMVIAKLLRPLTTRPMAVAGAHASNADLGDGDLGDVEPGGPGMESGLLGLAARLPAPWWLPAEELDQLTPQSLRRLAPRPMDVAPAPAWHRMRGPADLARLDPGLEGWDATRAILAAST
jgi:hypothetical protein